VLQQAREMQLEQLTAAMARWALHDTLPETLLPAVTLPCGDLQTKRCAALRSCYQAP
jgi:hypothetical protein